MSKWISVMDAMPDTSGIYLIFIPSAYVGRFMAVSYYNKPINRWFAAEAHAYSDGVTHWMPLPGPPDTEKRRK